MKLCRIELQAGGALCHMRSGTGTRWIIVPGGPGIGLELYNSLVPCFPADADVWGLKLPALAGPLTKTKIEKRWKEVLREAAIMGKCPIFFGHSFGGMLLLRDHDLETYAAGIVLVGCAPNSQWKRWAQEHRYLIDAKQELAATRNFERLGSEKALRQLFIAWAPYYFPPTSEESGVRLFSSCSFFPELYRQGTLYFLKGYMAKLVPTKVPTAVINGTLDRVTPYQLFQIPKFNRTNIEKYTVSDAGHFPWLEAEPIITSILRRIDARANDLAQVKI